MVVIECLPRPKRSIVIVWSGGGVTQETDPPVNHENVSQNLPTISINGKHIAVVISMLRLKFDKRYKTRVVIYPFCIILGSSPKELI